jgi:hypothetical protein
MDKLKPVLDIFVRFGFWILIGVVVVAGLGCWWVASKSVASEIKTKKDSLDKKFREVESIVSAPAPPNPKYIASLAAERDVLGDKVLASWKDLYAEQEKRNKWPEAELGKEFASMIKKLGPNDPIPEKHRRDYSKYIKDYLPKLKEAVDWRHPEKPNATPDPNAEVKLIGIVDWNKEDIKKLEEKYVSWKETPSDLAVRLAQEDLWVLESLLGVIRNTNGNTPDHSKAAIKHIDSLDFGGSAITAWKQAENTVFKGSEAAAAATPAAAAGSTPSEEATLKTNRYVDEKGDPLPAEGATAKSEFKRMPIRMKLYVNQRKIAKLLVECANSPMPIEVTRVRFKPNEGSFLDLATGSQSSGGGGGGGGMMGAPTGGFGGGGFGGAPGGGFGGVPGGGFGGVPGGGFGGVPGGGFGGVPGGGFGGVPYGRQGAGMPGMPMPQRDSGGGGNMPGVPSAWDKDDMDVPIEIMGVICIYNPPDVAKLGKKESTEGTPADATASATGNGASAAPAEPPAADKQPSDATAPLETPATEPTKTPDAAPAEPAGDKAAETPEPAETK